MSAGRAVRMGGRGAGAVLVAALAIAPLAPPPAGAMPADPTPAVFVQPDGARITLVKRGDEWLHWQEDVHGYPVVDVNGEWRYAQRDAAGDLAATAYVVGRTDPAAAGIERGGPRLTAQAEPLRTALRATLKPVGHANTSPTGTVKNLVVLCLFSDQTVAANGRDPAAFDTLYNTPLASGFNAPSGSVSDYYAQASYHQMSMVSTILAWVTLPHTEAYYANNQYGVPFGFSGNGNSAAPYPTNACGMVHDALAIIDNQIDLSTFDQNNDGYVDAIDFIHSGYGGEQNGNGPNTIWSHKYNLSSTNGGGVFTSRSKNGLGVNVKVDLYHTEPARWGTSGADLVRLGVICHETGHFFGLPDLYDLDGSSSGAGNYCLMANAWGWDGSQHYPPLPSAWCRIQLGWVTPATLSGPGGFSMPAVENTGNIVRVDKWAPGNEYLLIENRQPLGYDQQIPQGGFAIWHIDDNVGGNTSEGYPGQSGWPTNGSHYQVALLQADGKYDLEHKNNNGDAGDLYHDVPGIALSEATTPSSDNYQASSNYPTGTEISQISAVGQNMSFHYRPATWVDFSFGGFAHSGWYLLPYNTLADAILNTPDDGIVISRAGTTTEHPTLTRAMRFKSYGGATTIGP